MEATAAPKPEPPDWLTGTSRDFDYHLDMSHAISISPVELVELTRAEYVALKNHLGILRGFSVPLEETEEPRD